MLEVDHLEEQLVEQFGVTVYDEGLRVGVDVDAELLRGIFRKANLDFFDEDVPVVESSGLCARHFHLLQLLDVEVAESAALLCLQGCGGGGLPGGAKAG